ncbi:lysine--tRNA ligase [candidate division WOR-3 bacterium]|nr:lysine--tRNA ligase [candidate division WOR-3 bacterium]
MDETLDQVKFRKGHLDELKKRGINPYPYKFERTHTTEDLKTKFDSLENKDVSVAGRVMRIRSHGKSTFLDIQDAFDFVQIYLNKDTLSEDYEVVGLLDIGDFIGVKGKLMKTRTGEVTILVEGMTVLAKSLHPLPEKWHGLSDREDRYRKRYLDLIANEESGEVFKKRTLIIQEIRNFLNERGFVEVETPILQPQYGGGFAKPFKTYQESLKKDLFLRIAYELYLKRLIIGGMEKVYEIGKDFRNESVDRSHNPEFTMLELYQAYADYYDMMEIVEALFERLMIRFVGSKELEYQGEKVSFEKGWQRLSYYWVLQEKTGIDFKGLSFSEIKKQAKKLNIDIDGLYTSGKVLDAIFSEVVEPTIDKPTFIMDYPKDISPLAKDKRDEEGVVERFEPFLFGMEIGNAYSELNDPIEQRKRFEGQSKLREKGDLETESLDEDFLTAMSYGMPPTGGLGLGIDRIIMILLNQPSIRDVILFPQLK